MQRNHRRARRLAAVAAASLSAILAAPAAHALTLYDDFSGTAISPGRWDGKESTQYGASVAESRRAIQTGALRLEVKGWSDQHTNVGTGRARNEVILENSANVTEMKATVTPRLASAGICASNATPGASRARLIGTFFNIGDVKPGNEYNDVSASIQIYRASNSTDAAGVLRVLGSVFICTDSECIGSNSVGSSVDLGTTTINTPTDLHVTWDKANKQFIFQKNAEATQNIVYTYAESHVPEYAAKRLEAVADISNCTAARTVTTTWVDFDDVYTN